MNRAHARFSYPTSVVAHRGGGIVAPENTLAGLHEARQRGYAAVEFDVMLARDEAPVLMHDDTLDRTTNGFGAVPGLSAHELAGLDAGSWCDARFAGEPVPALEAAGQLCRALGLFANVEIKPYAPGGEVVARQTGAVVAERCARIWNGDFGGLLISSFAPAALAAARAIAPDLPRAYLFDAVPADWRNELARLECVALHCNAARLDAATAAAIKSDGYGLMCWTVNDLEFAARLFDWGVDAICTDRLDLFAGMAGRTVL